MSTNWEAADVLETPMEICWQFDYDIDIERLRNLYSKAKEAQWNAEQDIDWSTAIDPSRPLIDEASFGFDRLPFMQRLSQTQQESFRAHVGAHRLSQFLHGEQGALMTAAALTHAVPDYEGKLYAATQTMDEARHVEVFEKYVRKLARVYPMSPVLRSLIDDTLKADHWVKIAIGMNMVVEGLALGAFEALKAMVNATGGPQGTGRSAPDPGFRKAIEDADTDLGDFLQGLKEARDQGMHGGTFLHNCTEYHSYRARLVPSAVMQERPSVHYRYLKEAGDPESLGRCLDALFYYFTGIRHLMPGRPAEGHTRPWDAERINRQILERPLRRVLLSRRNRLQTVVSELMSTQTRVWQRDEGRIERPLEPLDPADVRQRLDWLRGDVEQYRDFLNANSLEFHEVFYEDIFDPCVDSDAQVARVREIFAHLGADEPSAEVWKRIRGLLDPGATRLNSEESYRLIPNADEIDAAFGGERDGRLFSD